MLLSSLVCWWYGFKLKQTVEAKHAEQIDTPMLERGIIMVEAESQIYKTLTTQITIVV
jgi:hypothetical protein